MDYIRSKMSESTLQNTPIYPYVVCNVISKKDLYLGTEGVSYYIIGRDTATWNSNYTKMASIQYLSWQARRGKGWLGHFQLPTTADIHSFLWAIPHGSSRLSSFIANQLCKIIEELDPFTWFVGRDGCNAGDNVHSF